MSDSNVEHAEEGDRQHQLVLATARARGITVTDVSDRMLCQAAMLELGGRAELLVKGIIASSMNLNTRYLCDFKQLSKLVFERVGIPSPRSMLFRTPEQPGLAAFIQADRSYVCKPQVAFNGVGVQMGITSFEQVCEYWQRSRDLDASFLLEEQYDGTDLRFQIIDRRIAAACVRVPAHVIGDGAQTLAQLVEARREVMRQQNPSNRLELDQASIALLEAQGLSPKSTPELGQHVRLKEVSNMGQGGHAIDVTEEIHPRYREWARRIVDFCDASYCALDFICEDPAKDPETSAIALEINSLAEWVHHTFSERRTHDLAGLVIDTTFGLGPST
jgi:D-alanine-D-alanine ligase-like ATP-grasp enzyme